MSKRILIDGVHQEEVRVVVTENSRLQDFEFETSAKKQIKGNIYLAKVTRVEPSLQAAFVEYGGNKQGFLPFSEVHPDYYSIPVSDQDPIPAQGEPNPEGASATANDNEAEQDGQPLGEEGDNPSDIDELGEESDVQAKRPNLHRRYKIQEVVKRGQVMLVQVIKEERGNKGASLTTFMSLPGRYSVFMPNSERQGGVSRRIGDIEDRKRLKTFIDELSLTDGASIIIRTAGSSASQEEIKRDYEYLNTTWENIKKQTISSNAPALIYEEGNIIKRTIRDLYDTSVEEIVVEGDAAFEEAKEVLKVLAPNQPTKLKLHTEDVPIFWHYEVEDELAKLYDNKAYLKSGGYIVLNSTEALVAIDVNSGKSTKERNVEETATKTNLEAAYEIARQLRLRDLAGLIVIDFIDMMDARNRRSVERALKDSLQADRAKIQVGRISPFGLLEMSRQRLHSSLVESAMVACQACQGTGIVRSPESTAMGIIRSINNEADKEGVIKVIVSAPMDVAFYLLNKKRSDLRLIEERCGIDIQVEGSESLAGQDYFIKSERDSAKEAAEKRSKKRRLPRERDNFEEREVDQESHAPRRDEREHHHRDRGDRDRHRDRGEGRDRDRDREGAPQGQNVYAFDDDKSDPRRRNRNRRGRRGGGFGGDRKNFDRRPEGGRSEGGRPEGGRQEGGHQGNNRNFQRRNHSHHNPRRDFDQRPASEASANRGGGENRGGPNESVLRSLWRKITE